MTTTAATDRVDNSLLAPLGLFGLEKIEPVLLAALIGEEPLLLIGPHGTGKSYLLLRLARALALEWRHYNASLIQFDDLVGYPLPDGKGGLDYVQTPATIWRVQAAFFDEIARCRPDMQNKLFPIIHEKRVQGMALEKLVYRWSAMNPPPADDDLSDRGYRGCEPLDAALADRFAFVVEMPAWETFTPVQQEEIIRAKDGPVDEAAAARLRGHVQSGRSLLPVVEAELSAPLAGYIRMLTALLRKAEVEISPRRAAMLLRNVLALHISRILRKADSDLGESAWLALQHSLPHAAAAIKVPAVKLLGAHNEAWKLARLKPDDPRRWLLLEPNAVRRALRAGQLNLPAGDFSGLVADALAELPPGGRHALAAALFERGFAGKLVAAVAEQAAQLYAFVAAPREVYENVEPASPRNQVWQHLIGTLSRLQSTDADTESASNLMTGLFAANQLPNITEVDRVLAAWQRTRGEIKGVV